jgi:hypothetical protein
LLLHLENFWLCRETVFISAGRQVTDLQVGASGCAGRHIQVLRVDIFLLYRHIILALRIDKSRSAGRHLPALQADSVKLCR